MRRFAFQAAAVLALVSTTSLQAAQAQVQCLTHGELRGMVAYFLPSVLQSTIDKCKPRLAADSYLVGRAPQLVSTLEAGRSEAWPLARQAFIKLGSDGKPQDEDLFASLPEEAIRPIVEAVIAQKIGPMIKPESCGDIDRIMAPLEPLPATNLIDVLTEAMVVAGRKDKQMPVCPSA